jgi:hypothetical protein
MFFKSNVIEGVLAMAQKESHSGQTEKLPLPNLVTAEFAAMGKKRVEELAKVQKELLDKLQETNRRWLERMQLEMKFASEFASKLTTVRSIPDAAAVCQEWMTRRLEMMTEDGKRVFADTQKFMETGAHLLANGRSGGPGASS